MNNVFSLENKVALITGGGSGLGYSIAECMISSGANVIVVGSNKEKTISAANSLGSNAFPMVFDVSSHDEAEGFIQEIINKYGQIDILINNAGNHCKKTIENMTIKDFTSIIDVHLIGSFALSKAVVPYMKKQGDGVILYTASMTSFIGQPYVSGYSAAKSAFLGLIRGLATELGSYNIRVNGVAPGWIDTPMLRKAILDDNERRDKILNRTPMNKFGEPEDIGWSMVYLSSPAAKFINGHVLVVDGGALIGF